ncbi:MAG: bifunctional folylpolyglutamate synthase/dihydrofolate synthase [Spirochaetales bacterium]|nr:bifunctional folylpolyglutamate synthase/dihydrofolate synthase [Spirochaetales bacterium]
MKFTHIEEAFTYIESFTNLEKTMHYTVRTYRLDRMHQLLDFFGNPERSCPVIHTAGSKGKGSTCIFIAKALEKMGFTVGLYSSPHVSTYLERFTLAGTFFPEEQILETINFMVDELSTFSFPEKEGFTSPTTFELLTLLGFLLFQKAECDYAVIETGLGGRLDATNVAAPLISVITPIELEHTQILGSTYAEIAAEKGGIIKNGVPVLSAAQHPDAKRVLAEIAEKRASSMLTLTDYLYHSESKTHLQGTDVCLHWNSGHVQKFRLRLHGNFQAENAALAILTIKTLGFLKDESAEAALLKGLSEADIPGRMDVIGTEPPIIIDGAHTQRSMEKIIESYRSMYPSGGAIIFGAVKGKDHARMAETILREFNRIIISTPGSFKPSDPEGLFNLFSEISHNLESEGHLSAPPILLLEHSPSRALQRSRELLYSSSEGILVTGSFYMAAEIYSCLKNQ